MPVTDPMDAMLDYAACMREHGVDMPDPRAGGGGLVMEFEGPATDSDEPDSFGGDIGDIPDQAGKMMPIASEIDLCPIERRQ